MTEVEANLLACASGRGAGDRHGAAGAVLARPVAAGGVARVESRRPTGARAALRAGTGHGLPFRGAVIRAVRARDGLDDALATGVFQDGRRLGCVTFLDRFDLFDPSNPFDPATAGRLGLGPA